MPSMPVGLFTEAFTEAVDTRNFTTHRTLEGCTEQTTLESSQSYRSTLPTNYGSNFNYPLPWQSQFPPPDPSSVDLMGGYHWTSVPDVVQDTGVVGRCQQVNRRHTSTTSTSVSANVSPTVDTSSTHRCLPVVLIPREESDQWVQARIEDGKKVYTCLWPGCAHDPFRAEKNAQSHYRQHRVRGGHYACETCKTTFTTKDNAKRHEKTHGRKDYPCLMCGASFARKDYRNIHQNRCNNPQRDE
ncbi:hypothetical protein K439DRAFT_724174 [Ramaria rubella]|nr:hypothetical protein K439DRAFT_724174 [Ramaria rubella]